MKALMGRLVWLFFYSQTSATRFWFSLASIGFGVFMFRSPYIHNPSSEYGLMLEIMPQGVWGFLFILHGASLMYGVLTRKFNVVLLIAEGVLGSALWVTACTSMTLMQGSLGPSFAGAAMACWIAYRYPTHTKFNASATESRFMP